MHDTIARDKNTIPTMSEPKKWHPTKKKKRTKWRSYGIHTKHGWFPCQSFHAHFFFLPGLFLKMKTTKRREGHSS
jgi:hypothetical protein